MNVMIMITANMDMKLLITMMGIIMMITNHRRDYLMTKIVIANYMVSISGNNDNDDCNYDDAEADGDDDANDDIPNQCNNILIIIMSKQQQHTYDDIPKKNNMIMMILQLKATT